MEYELQLNPFVRKAGWKYEAIQITDIAVHTKPKKPTTSIGKKIRQAFRSMKPGRIYGTIDNTATTSESRTAIIELLKKDSGLLEYIRQREQNGYKVLVSIPNEIPIIAGDDTIEFMASVHGKRILRRLEKDNLSS